MFLHKKKQIENLFFYFLNCEKHLLPAYQLIPLA